jgi:endonuclease/exonuclease/phosphatase family metal-dependent hydrolase
MEFRLSGAISVIQQVELRTVMDAESNWAIKVMMGDYNVRPGNLPGIGMYYNASANYGSYREADEVPKNAGVYNSTRNPPGSYPNQKIDYIFVGRYWTSNANGYQELSCTTSSDHCLVLGDFYAN